MTPSSWIKNTKQSNQLSAQITVIGQYWLVLNSNIGLKKYQRLVFIGVCQLGGFFHWKPRTHKKKLSKNIVKKPLKVILNNILKCEVLSVRPKLWNPSQIKLSLIQQASITAYHHTSLYKRIKIRNRRQYLATIFQL